MDSRTNCPNCGAPIKDLYCEYCGTRVVDLSYIDLNKESYFCIILDGQKYFIKAFPTTFTITHSLTECYSYDEFHRVLSHPAINIDLSLQGSITPGYII